MSPQAESRRVPHSHRHCQMHRPYCSRAGNFCPLGYKRVRMCQKVRSSEYAHLSCSSARHGRRPQRFCHGSTFTQVGYVVPLELEYSTNEVMWCNQVKVFVESNLLRNSDSCSCLFLTSLHSWTSIPMAKCKHHYILFVHSVLTKTFGL